jgi:hypothetical protein
MIGADMRPDMARTWSQVWTCGSPLCFRGLASGSMSGRMSGVAPKNCVVDNIQK